MIFELEALNFCTPTHLIPNTHFIDRAHLFMLYSQRYLHEWVWMIRHAGGMGYNFVIASYRSPVYKVHRRKRELSCSVRLGSWKPNIGKVYSKLWSMVCSFITLVCANACCLTFKHSVDSSRQNRRLGVKRSKVTPSIDWWGPFHKMPSQILWSDRYSISAHR